MKGNYRVASILADRERGCRQCRRALQTVSLECLRIGDAGSQGGDNGSKQLTLKDLGVSSPPSSRRTEGSDLKQAFERAAGEIIYRLDLLNKIDVGRQSPVIISINL